MPTPPIIIDRLFRDLSDEMMEALDSGLLLTGLGWSGAFGWETLLRSRRILLVSEAGAGKTHETKAQRERLLAEGTPAFYLDLAELARNPIEDLLLPEDRKRLEQWRHGDGDAVFFLDSIDELNLTQGVFRTALTRLAGALDGQLGRARIVITTRPVPVERALIDELLPMPAARGAPSATSFAEIAMGNAPKAADDGPPSHRHVALMPLTDAQIKAMASAQGVGDPDRFFDEVKRTETQEFARRPQDLIEMCADWHVRGRIGTHREQVESNVEVKLKPAEGRAERADLPLAQAREGASRLALAALLTRKLTIRYSAAADEGDPAMSALAPELLLTEWGADLRRTLLERPLFGFASYGRVRFHHRSVIDFLAAERLRALRPRLSLKALKRLLFADTPQGERVVRPSMRAVAAWLASDLPEIFAEVRDRDPFVLLDFGDPASLSVPQRAQALAAYVERYGSGSNRGLHVPRIQVARFAAPDLASVVERLWAAGIENGEVRRLLLNLIGAGTMHSCADIAHACATDRTIDDYQRLRAVSALVALGDRRLTEIGESLETEPAQWSDSLARSVLLELFPDHVAPDRFCRVAARLRSSERSVGDFEYTLPRLIEAERLSLELLEALRVGLTAALGVSTKTKKWPHYGTDAPHLLPGLAAVCAELMRAGRSEPDVVESATLALRIARPTGGFDEPRRVLETLLKDAPAAARRGAFWADDAFMQRVKVRTDPWERLFAALHDGAVTLTQSDRPWVLADLADRGRPADQRAVMLEAAVRDVADPGVAWVDGIEAMRPLVADSAELSCRVEQLLNPPKASAELRRMQRENAKRAEQARRRRAKDHASWVQLWHEIVGNPAAAFGPDQAGVTSWNLWRVMTQAGTSRSLGWDRTFLEQHFSPAIADETRRALMQRWRDLRPTLPRERPEAERGTYQIGWTLGLAGLTAEAEDRQWTSKLQPGEAEHAARFAPLALNGFPAWLEDLARTNPGAVTHTLLPELVAVLDETPVNSGHLSILQDIEHAPAEVAALFLEPIRKWFGELPADMPGPAATAMDARLRQVLPILLKHGDADDAARIRAAIERALAVGPGVALAASWLSLLMRLDPAAASDRLEAWLETIPPAPDGPAIAWFGAMFGERDGRLSVDLSDLRFTAPLLLRLAKIAHRYVAKADDLEHEEVYSPGARDHAQRGRDAIVGRLVHLKGLEAWAAKLELAGDPMFLAVRDRIRAIARETAAGEVDVAVYAELDVRQLELRAEGVPKSRADMLALLIDRLDDIGELLLADSSPREAWAGIAIERVMRREVARSLEHMANGMYRVEQETVTADEKETDVRLVSTASPETAVIELKIGEKHSGTDIRDALDTQLLRKYLAPENRKVGCLLVTVASDRTWDHPQTGQSLSFNELIAYLGDEAAKIMIDHPEVSLLARGLDLRPRLPTEREASRKS